MVIDDMQQDNSEMNTVYPPRVLREWLESNFMKGWLFYVQNCKDIRAVHTG